MDKLLTFDDGDTYINVMHIRSVTRSKDTEKQTAITTDKAVYYSDESASIVVAAINKALSSCE